MLDHILSGLNFQNVIQAGFCGFSVLMLIVGVYFLKSFISVLGNNTTVIASMKEVLQAHNSVVKEDIHDLGVKIIRIEDKVDKVNDRLANRPCFYHSKKEE